MALLIIVCKFSRQRLDSRLSVKCFCDYYLSEINCLMYYSGDHTEVIEMVFDPKIVSYENLLDIFWNNHEYGVTTKVKTQVTNCYHDR